MVSRCISYNAIPSCSGHIRKDKERKKKREIEEEEREFKMIAGKALSGKGGWARQVGQPSLILADLKLKRLEFTPDSGTTRAFPSRALFG